MGPYNYGITSCADDFMGMTNDESKFQCIIDIAQHYGEMYDITYGSDNSKKILYGSKCDQDFFSDIHPWTINNDLVVSDNVHLRQVFSNINEYM